MDHRQSFIGNNHGCFLIRNVDQLQHIKDATNSRRVGT